MSTSQERNATGAGKGDAERISNRKIYDERFDAINWASKQQKDKMKEHIYKGTK